jgi:predicted nucleic acid-binding Zn ribbon protein
MIRKPKERDVDIDVFLKAKAGDPEALDVAARAMIRVVQKLCSIYTCQRGRTEETIGDIIAEIPAILQRWDGKRKPWPFFYRTVRMLIYKGDAELSQIKINNHVQNLARRCDPNWDEHRISKELGVSVRRAKTIRSAAGALNNGLVTFGDTVDDDTNRINVPDRQEEPVSTITSEDVRATIRLLDPVSASLITRLYGIGVKKMRMQQYSEEFDWPLWAVRPMLEIAEDNLRRALNGDYGFKDPRRSIRRECPNCGKRFEPTGNQHSYCSESCKLVARKIRESRNIQILRKETSCVMCGKDITATDSKRYCSPQCRKNFWSSSEIKLETKTQCAQCGTEFDSLKGKKYCSQTCKSRVASKKFRKKLIANRPKTSECAVCAAVYPYRRGKIYCSARCNRKANPKKKRKAPRGVPSGNSFAKSMC